MARSKDLTTYCTNANCPAAASCRRYTRRADDEMPAGTVAMKFVVVEGGLHCGSYIHKAGHPSLSSQLKAEMDQERLRSRKLLLWLRKTRASLSVARRAMSAHGHKSDDAFAKSAFSMAHADVDRTLNSTGGPNALPEPFDILKYLRNNGRNI
jgi:hypothetical protein